MTPFMNACMCIDVFTLTRDKEKVAWMCFCFNCYGLMYTRVYFVYFVYAEDRDTEEVCVCVCPIVEKHNLPNYVKAIKRTLIKTYFLSVALSVVTECIPLIIVFMYKFVVLVHFMSS